MDSTLFKFTTLFRLKEKYYYFILLVFFSWIFRSWYFIEKNDVLWNTGMFLQ